MTGPRSAVLRARGRTRARVLGCAFGAPSSDVRSQSRRLRAWHRPSVRCHPESPFGSDAPSDDDPTAPIVRFVPPTFTTKELSKRTWPDYARFFSQGNGWDHCGCTFMQGFRAPKHLRKWADQRDWNLEVKRGLVEDVRAHCVLVEAGVRRRLFADGEERLWKITCFCTHPHQPAGRHRRCAARGSRVPWQRREEVSLRHVRSLSPRAIRRPTNASPVSSSGTAPCRGSSRLTDASQNRWRSTSATARR